MQSSGCVYTAIGWMVPSLAGNPFILFIKLLNQYSVWTIWSAAAGRVWVSVLVLILSLFSFSRLHVCSCVNVLFYDRPHLREGKKRDWGHFPGECANEALLSAVCQCCPLFRLLGCVLHVCQRVRKWERAREVFFRTDVNKNTYHHTDVRLDLNYILNDFITVYFKTLCVSSSPSHVIYCNVVFFWSFRSLAVGKMTAALRRGGRPPRSYRHLSCLWPQQWKMWSS